MHSDILKGSSAQIIDWRESVIIEKGFGHQPLIVKKNFIGVKNFQLLSTQCVYTILERTA